MAERNVEISAEKLARQNSTFESLNQRLAMLTFTDDLTGLSNSRRFHEVLEETFGESVLTKKPFSLLLLDIDLFKEVNDQSGHAVGDHLLAEFAGVLRSICRRGEVPARIGSEKFAVVLKGATAEQSLKSAERFRKAVLNQKWQHHAVTVSIGAGTLAPNAQSTTEVVRQADFALNHSKEHGRNRSTHYEKLAGRSANHLAA